MKYSKKWLRASAVFACVTVLFLLLFGAGEGISRSLVADTDIKTAGENWSAAGEPYATFALHTDENAAMSRTQIEGYAASIHKKLEEASVSSSEKGSVWTYCFFGENTVRLTGMEFEQAELH